MRIVRHNIVPMSAAIFFPLSRSLYIIINYYLVIYYLVIYYLVVAGFPFPVKPLTGIPYTANAM